MFGLMSICLQHRDQSVHQNFAEAMRLMALVDDSYQTPAGITCQQQAVAMMALLDCLNLDHQVILAAMLYNAVQYADLSSDLFADTVSAEIVALISGVKTMDALHHIHQSGVAEKNCHAASDNLRRMMLAHGQRCPDCDDQTCRTSVFDEICERFSASSTAFNCQ